MTIEIKVPVLPESVPDATISSINHKVGDIVNEGQTLLELETDKIMIEVPATTSGKITDLKVTEGQQVKTDQILCLVDDSIKPDTSKETAKEKSEPKIEKVETKKTSPTKTKTKPSKTKPAVKKIKKVSKK